MKGAHFRTGGAKLTLFRRRTYDARPRGAGRPGRRGFVLGAWRSLVAHLLWEQRVGGSNPSAPTNPLERP
jgi:hypothetical protein